MLFLTKIINQNCGYCNKKLVLGPRSGSKMFCNIKCRAKLIKWLMSHTRIIFESVRSCVECQKYFGIIANINENKYTCGNPKCRSKLATRNAREKVINKQTRMYKISKNYPKNRSETCHHIHTDKVSCKYYNECLDSNNPKCSDGSEYTSGETKLKKDNKSSVGCTFKIDMGRR